MATIRGLVNNALYQSLYDRRFNKIDQNGGDNITVAIDRLNRVLDANRNIIPFVYRTEYSTYALMQAAKFVVVSNVDYVMGEYVINLIKAGLSKYNQVKKIENLTAVPAYYWHDDLNQTIETYPLPSSGASHKFVVYGCEALTPVLIDDALPTAMTLFFQEFLELLLAYDLCVYYNKDFSDIRMKKLQELTAMVNRNKRRDTRHRETPVMSNGSRNGAGGFPYFYYASGGTPRD